MEKKNKVLLVKTVVGLTLSACVGTAVGLAFRHNIDIDALSGLKKIAVVVGAGAIGGLAGSAVARQAGETIDTFVALNDLINEEIEKAVSASDDTKKEE